MTPHQLPNQHCPDPDRSITGDWTVRPGRHHSGTTRTRGDNSRSPRRSAGDYRHRQRHGIRYGSRGSDSADGSQGIGTRVRAGRAAGARSPAIVTTNRFLLDTSVLHHVTRRQPPTRTGPRPAGWSPSASRPRRLVSLPSAPRPVRRMTALAPTTRRIAPTEVPWAVSEICKPANPLHRRQLRHAEHRGHPQ